MTATSLLARSSLLQDLSVQVRVIGAVMMREIHTRFGRNNIGYLWLIVEPMILAAGISSFHLATHVHLPFGFQPASFYASGYITFIVFRNNVNRAAGLVHSNKPLLFHKCVTLMDLAIGRALLECAATSGAMILILGFFIVTGFCDFPARPWFIVAGIALMTWLSFAMSLVISGGTELIPLTERLVHPFTYLTLPLSGIFFVLDEMPPAFSRFAHWLVVPQFTDIARMGLLSDFNSSYITLPYDFAICGVMTFVGALLLRIARNRMHFD